MPDWMVEGKGKSSPKRVLLIGAGVGKDAQWPARMCGRSNRLVETLPHPHFERGRLGRVGLCVGYVRMLWPLVLLRWHYDGYVFLDANEGIVFAAAAKLLRLSRPKIVLFDLIAYKGGLFRRLVNTLIAYASSRTDAVSVASDGLAQLYGCFFPELRGIYCIPGAFATSPAPEQPVAEDGSIFSGGGSLRDWPTLLAAARQLPEQRFAICARASDPVFASASLPPNVKVWFDLEYDQFHSLMDLASIVVLPIYDAQTTAGLMVLGSALRRGKPTIVTRTIVTKDYVQHEDNGLLVAPGNVDDLVTQIRRLLADSKLRARLSQRAREWSRGPTQSEFFRRFKEMLDEVLA